MIFFYDKNRFSSLNYILSVNSCNGDVNIREKLVRIYRYFQSTQALVSGTNI